MEVKNCPTCDVSWLQKDNIVQYFKKEYKKEGIPNYLKKAGVNTVDEAARLVAASYGCHSKNLKHFGMNHQVINCHGNTWLHCEVCGVAHDESNLESTTIIFNTEITGW
ncbi:MAG: hypothetical protein GY804_00090 [Alphaproteobacteria bacterium]|nr:hypothetical protein [Alphaproteobacteria bacterium]